MAYKNGKRTVYCRQCYQVGHNRRGCPTLSPELKAMYKNGDRARKCSYCSEKGHTKRKCEKRTKDIAEYAAENKKYRKAYLDAMVQHGLSIGSLVTHMGAKGEMSLADMKPEHIGMVTHIEWNDIQYRRRSNRPIQAKRLGEQENTYNSDMWLGNPPINSDDYESWGRCQVLSRRNDIMSYVPADWLDGLSGAEEFF
jgi:hypothetical protein